MKFCGEIQYENSDGTIHSDVCHGCQSDKQFDSNDREFYHQLLDEWLNNSNGTGHFWIGDAQSLFSEE